jgi:glycosyltransferase involved in cell wall biosynthesis
VTPHVQRGPAGDVAVTTLVTTYNHATFIEQAIDSALMQEVQGDHEILVVDDYSTDGTRDIVQDYATRNPGVIRALLSDRNEGPCASRARGILEARGHYVALLDGDDYWTSPEKLRKQLGFFSSHPDCAVCCHNALVAYQDGSAEAHPFYTRKSVHRISEPQPQQITSLRDLVRGNFMLTNTVMLRGGLVEQFPDWYFDHKVERVADDWALYIMAAQHGDIGYLDEMMSVYRVHGGGAWSDSRSHLRVPADVVEIIWIHDTINQYLGLRYDKNVKRKTAYLSDLAAGRFAREGRFDEGAELARRSLRDARDADVQKGMNLLDRLRLEVLARPTIARWAIAIVSRTRRATTAARRVSVRFRRVHS